MNFIEKIINRAKKNLKTIVLPESNDRRVLEAAEITLKENIANIIIIGTEEDLKESSINLDLSKANIINPYNNDLTEKLINKLVDLRKDKGMTYEKAKELMLNDYMYYACMLVEEGYADGVVSGACHYTSDTIRPALQIIKTKKDTNLVSAFFLVEVPNCEYGEHGTFIFADAGLNQEPTSPELAEIAKTSADSFKELVGVEPVVAMLSHSTKGSAKHEKVTKVIEATKIAKEKYPQYKIDGELQLDSAIVEEVAKQKAPSSTVAGHANVLIFPDLDSGNIGYKLVQRLAKANAYGPICQGIKHPINDLSRGCTKEDIVGVIAITSVQASSINKSL